VRAGNEYIRARKYQKGATDLMYVSTDREFNLHSEDVRFVNLKHKEMQVRRSSRKTSVTNTKTIELDEVEMETLKSRCWRPDLGEVCQ
jgi:hypothetical protein